MHRDLVVRAAAHKPGIAVASIAALLIILAGCVGTRTAQPPEACSIDQTELLGQIDSRQLAMQLTEGLCPPPYDGTRNEAVPSMLVVADPVDVQTYLPNHLGRAFGDVFRSAVFQRCNVPIRQIELGRDFSLTREGITALTRNLLDVRGGSFHARDAIITTYSLSKSRAYFVARRLDLSDGAITAMSTREVSWHCEKDLLGKSSIQTVVK